MRTPVLAQIGGGGTACRSDQVHCRPFDYSQPISTTAAAPAAPVAAKATAGFDQARDAFKQGNYALAVQLGEQALGQMPNDPNIHQFLALGLFAQGQYDQAAAPLYAVLTIGPGWNWTTLIGYVCRGRRVHAAAPGSGGVRQGEPSVGPGPLRAGLSLSDPGAQ